MSASVDKLARQIASLSETELQTLFERVEQLNFRQELHALSIRYRERLKRQGDLDEGAEEVMRKLKLIREEIAAREYPG
jgi:AraC-like DNA-binding protein